ncbi:phage transcriptional regulator [Clostridium baratii]|uniref:helix-turn-helix transcriptional regulator n=1 Tax=Clostridium baratii TaxID=1561 RepID=UPI0006C296CA|nr:helix-turn-helix transcriptional regulator [Clostridium baratii]CUP24894.1 phage transcriptional regulator [Clostridium baratii]
MLKFNVRSERVKQNIKQGEFAKELGITPQYLCLIEKGEVEPRRDLMIKIAKALKSDVVTLFFSEEE